MGLPKAHVEVLTPRSVILARLMLKFRMPFLSRLFDELFFGLFFGFLVCFLLLFTKDFKVFVAYSSILHMTVFCLRLYLFNVYVFEYFLVPHTLLSGCMFFYFSFLVRIYPFFGSFFKWVSTGVLIESSL